MRAVHALDVGGNNPLLALLQNASATDNNDLYTPLLEIGLSPATTPDHTHSHRFLRSMSASGEELPPIRELSTETSGLSSTSSEPPPATPRLTPNDQAEATTTPIGTPASTSRLSSQTIQDTPNVTSDRARSSEANPPTPDDEAPPRPSKRRSAATMAVENEKSSRTDDLVRLSLCSV